MDQRSFQGQAQGPNSIVYHFSPISPDPLISPVKHTPLPWPVWLHWSVIP